MQVVDLVDVGDRGQALPHRGDREPAVVGGQQWANERGPLCRRVSTFRAEVAGSGWTEWYRAGVPRVRLTARWLRRRILVGV